MGQRHDRQRCTDYIATTVHIGHRPQHLACELKPGHEGEHRARFTTVDDLRDDVRRIGSVVLDAIWNNAEELRP